MRLAGEERDVGAGDCVVIPPGTPHKLWAAGGRGSRPALRVRAGLHRRGHPDDRAAAGPRGGRRSGTACPRSPPSSDAAVLSALRRCPCCRSGRPDARLRSRAQLRHRPPRPRLPARARPQGGEPATRRRWSRRARVPRRRPLRADRRGGRRRRQGGGRSGHGRRRRAGGASVELGAGTGHYLASVLGRAGRWDGLALDSSRAALRRAVRGRSGDRRRRLRRVGAAAGQAERPSTSCSACSPPARPAEIARILADEGTLVVVTPAARTPRREISAARHDRRRPGQAGAAPRPAVVLTCGRSRAARSSSSWRSTTAAVRPSPGWGRARHVTPAVLADRVARLPEPVRVSRRR